MDEFVQFQSFYNDDESVSTIETLKANNIEYRIERFKEILDAVMVGDLNEKIIFLKIRSHDFQKANEALDKKILNNIATLENDYYLFSFPNDELLEIIQKPDEWSRQDFLIAKKILNDRGTDLSDEKISTIKVDRIKSLAKQESGNIPWLILGYALALLGGLFGLIIGLPFIFAKKTLPDGSRMYIYNKYTRQHGKNIVIISVIVLCLNLFFNDNIKYAFVGFFGYTF